VVLDMDGFGAPAAKIGHYDAFVRRQGVPFTGMKLFYSQHHPLMSPGDVLDQDPPPDVIIYQ
jgi:hypothetical protein